MLHLNQIEREKKEGRRQARRRGESVSRFAPANERERKSASGNIGCELRASMIRKSTRKNDGRAERDHDRRDERSRVAMIQSTRKPETPDRELRAILPTSPGCGLSSRALSGTRQSEMKITTSASGRLIKKTARQETCSINQPPSTGPTAAVIGAKTRPCSNGATTILERETNC